MQGNHGGKEEEKEEIEQRVKLVEDWVAKGVPYGGVFVPCVVVEVGV